MKCKLTKEQRVFIEKNFNWDRGYSYIEKHVVFNAMKKEGIEPPVTFAEMDSYISYKMYGGRTVFSRIWKKVATALGCQD